MLKIDIDVSGDDRQKVYDYIINRFGVDKTAYILAIGTAADKGAIDDICRGLSRRWEKENLIDIKEIKKQISEEKLKGEISFKEVEALQEKLAKAIYDNEKMSLKNPFSLNIASVIKKEYESDKESTRKKYKEVFYYFDGIVGTKVSQSMHPAGIIASPITLDDNYGTFENEGMRILQIDMECVHDVSLVKYDILGLKNIKIIRDAYKMIGKPYPLSHEINWYDEAVWNDMLKSRIGIFQFEGRR